MELSREELFKLRKSSSDGKANISEELNEYHKTIDRIFNARSSVEDSHMKHPVHMM